MMPGKPKPTRLKLITGNPGKRPLNRNEPEPRRGRPRMPVNFNRDARREWRRIVPELDRLGLLTVLDASMIEGHCRNYARACAAERILDREGLVLDGKKHPAATIAKECWQLVRSFGSEFGLSSSSRARLTTGEKKPEDTLSAFLAAKPKGA